jgi:hypothetical protein
VLLPAAFGPSMTKADQLEREHGGGPASAPVRRR